MSDATSLGAGFYILLKNTGSGTITVSRATGGNTINGAAADITIAPGDTFRIQVIAAATGFMAMYMDDTTATVPVIDISSANGRLTLTTLVPITTADVLAAATIYFTPYKGNRIALHDGANWNSFSFPELSLLTPANVGKTVTITIASPGVVTETAHGKAANTEVKFTTTGTLPTGLVAGTIYFVVGSSITADTYQVSATANGAAINTSGTQSGVHTATSGTMFDMFMLNVINTVTITIASPGVVTETAHGRAANDPVVFTTTGALPTGLVAGTTYYIVGASVTTNTYQVSATPGGAAINTSGSQSGVHTATGLVLESLAWSNDVTRATALVTQDGILVKSGATTRRYLGSFRGTITSGQTEDSLAKRYVWNYYNQKLRPMKGATETTDSWPYSTAAFRQANANAANQLDYVMGVSEESVHAFAATNISSSVLNSSDQHLGIGVDSTTVSSAQIMMLTSPNSATATTEIMPIFAEYRGFPGVGRHFLAWLEYAGTTGVTSWYGDNGSPTNTQAGIMGELMG